MVDALVLLGEVTVPIGSEITISDQGAEFQDGFGSGQAAASTGDVQAITDLVAAGALDHALFCLGARGGWVRGWLWGCFLCGVEESEVFVAG